VNFPPKKSSRAEEFSNHFFTSNSSSNRLNFHFNPLVQHINELIRLNYPIDWLLIPFFCHLKLGKNLHEKTQTRSERVESLNVSASFRRCWEKIILRRRILTRDSVENVENSALHVKRGGRERKGKVWKFGGKQRRKVYFVNNHEIYAWIMQKRETNKIVFAL
jgi:hypothetical protein